MAKAPPITGPLNDAIIHTLERRAIVRGTRWLGKKRSCETYTRAIRPPPPSPCKTRPMSSTGMLGAVATTTQPMLNTIAVRIMVAFKPRFATSRLIDAADVIEPTR